MDNCLKSTLKTVVNNESLPVLGTFTVHSLGQSSTVNTFRVEIKGGKSVLFNTNDENVVFLATNTNEMSFSANQAINISTSAPCDISINPYYEVTYIRISDYNVASINAKELNRCLPYFSDLYYLNLSGLRSPEQLSPHPKIVNMNLIPNSIRQLNVPYIMFGNIDDLDWNSLVSLDCPTCTSIEGNIISFLNKNLNLYHVNFTQCDVMGDVSDLIVNENITGIVNFVGTKVTGSLAVARQKFPNVSEIRPSSYMTE